MKCRKLYLTLCWLVGCFASFAQFDQLKKDIALTDSLNDVLPREKIFIHYDRQYYLINDTLWLKGYTLSARDLSAADSSRIAYIELIDAEGKSIRKISTHALYGLFYASITLNETDFKQGTYLMRAWTNHMRNYGDSLFFQSKFNIVNPGSKDWEAVTALQAGNIDNNEIKTRLQPSGGATQMDLQFLPEGGNFIVGKRQCLGFKALDVFGKGIDLSGRIENSKKQLITPFNTERNGMGMCWLTPEPNEKYVAILDNGRTYELPTARVSGTLLQVNNNYHADSMEVIVDASPDLYDKDYFFRASAKGISCAYGSVRLRHQPYRRVIAKNAFPSGICRYTLYDNKNLPVNERVVFVWHNDTLQLSVSTHKPVYENRDSVDVLLTTKNEKNEPIQAALSAAVIDTGRVPYKKYVENIISYMMLSSDLRGNIEEPAYYIDEPYSNATEALMLTQGWVQYNRFFTKPAYAYETEFAVTGKVLNILNKPVVNSAMSLFAKDGRYNSFFMEANTDKSGRFVFNNFPPITTDSMSLLIKGLNRKGKSFGIGVEVDLPGFPVYKFKPARVAIPSIVHDTVAMSYIKQENNLHKKEFGKEYLQEVIVTARARVKGSKNLNEDGGSDLVINEKILAQMPKESLLDVLRKELKGFHKGTFPRTMYQTYKVNGDIAVFVIDGYNISQYYEPFNHTISAYVDYLNTYLNYISAEDIAGIEFMSSSKYTSAYETEWSTPHYNATGGKGTFLSSVLLKYVFIEVTTYSGNGAFYKKVPGIYLYKPLAPVVARSFYAPRYNTTDTSSTPDYRATVYWKPDILTDKNGEARFSFYTSDSKSGYLVIVQGADLTGKVGFALLPLYIRREDKTANK